MCINNNKIISIIIPVYNTEKYLSRCIDSVLSQSWTDIEVILVNDGSIDYSGNICDKYAALDHRVKVIHIKNQGVCHARNIGLYKAKGDYVLFVDSDDWIDTNMCGTLIDMIQNNNADMSTCGYKIEDENGNIIYEIKERYNYVLNKWDSLITLFKPRDYKYKGNMCDKLFLREKIVKNELSFNEKIFYNEDRLFIYNYMLVSNKVAYTTIPYYHYIQHKNSAMNSMSQTYNKKQLTFMDAFDQMISQFYQLPFKVRKYIVFDYLTTGMNFLVLNNKNISKRLIISKWTNMFRYIYYLSFIDILKFIKRTIILSSKLLF